MDKLELRKAAINSYLEGEKVTNICRSLEISRKWFYKWYNRYQTGDDDWYKDHSKAPKNCPHKVDEGTEQLVLRIREKLEQTKYAQIGAIAISWEITKLGNTAPPIWMINRILKRHGKVKAKSKRNNRKSNIDYPYFTEPFYPNHIHQADLIGPRYIKDDGRFYSLSTIDLFTHRVWSVPIRYKDDDSIIQALIMSWEQIGIPEILQLDNELSFQGSNRYPHSFGKVIQFCLSLNVQVVFIPLSEPWRNGVIERFNRTFENNFYRTERFKNFNHLKEQLINFLCFHNANHVYSANHGKTPNHVLENENIKINKLAADFEFRREQTLPYESYIHYIRFIRGDLKLSIRGETFKMPKKAMYQYVRATIFTEFHQLNIFLEDEIIIKLPYQLYNFNQEYVDQP